MTFSCTHQLDVQPFPHEHEVPHLDASTSHPAVDIVPPTRNKSQKNKCQSYLSEFIT